MEIKNEYDTEANAIYVLGIIKPTNDFVKFATIQLHFTPTVEQLIKIDSEIKELTDLLTPSNL